MANRFDKPFYKAKSINPSLKSDLFSIIGEMDTDKLLQFKIQNRISLGLSDENGNNLIHLVLLNEKNHSEIKKINTFKFLFESKVNQNIQIRIMLLLYILLVINNI